MSLGEVASFGTCKLVLSIFRRAASRFGEAGFLVALSDALQITENAVGQIADNFLGFALVSAAASALFDLFDIATRPDLSISRDKQPTLPYGEPK